MSVIQELKSVRFPFAYWPNSLDARDVKTAGTPRADLTNEIGVPILAGAWIRDFLYTANPIDNIDDVGFILRLHLSSNNLMPRYICNGHCLGLGRVNSSAGIYHIYHPRPIIDIYNGGGSTLYIAYRYSYIPRSILFPESPGEESPVDSVIRGARLPDKPRTTKDAL